MKKYAVAIVLVRLNDAGTIDPYGITSMLFTLCADDINMAYECVMSDIDVVRYIEDGYTVSTKHIVDVQKAFE